MSNTRRMQRKATLSHLGWAAFTISVASFLLAAWTFDQRWLATAFTMLGAAAVLGLGAADL